MLALKRVLLVEDDLIDIKTFKRAFNSITNKYQLESKINGKEALDYLRAINSQEKPDLIFLDINMPIMNGIEFLQILKQDHELRTIPIIMLTTSDDIKDKELCFSLSAAGYFTKRANFDEFEKMLATIINYWEESELIKK